jgi:hypothetical protein
MQGVLTPCNRTLKFWESRWIPKSPFWEWRNHLSHSSKVGLRHVICGTSCLYSLSCVSCGIIICDIYVICLVAYTIIGIANGSTLPLIIFCAFICVLSCSFFTPKHEALPSSTLFFLLRTFIGKYVASFFLFSNDVYISSPILKILVGGLSGFSFWCTNEYWKIFANTDVDW